MTIKTPRERQNIDQSAQKKEADLGQKEARQQRKAEADIQHMGGQSAQSPRNGSDKSQQG